MTSEKNVKIYAQITISIFIISAIIMFILWFDKFHDNPISTKPSDWSNFATLFSGFLTPFIGVLNILVFIHLTNRISSVDKERSKDALEHQIKADEIRSNREIDVQIKIIRYQSQLEELRKLENECSILIKCWRTKMCPTVVNLEVIHRTIVEFAYNPELGDILYDEYDKMLVDEKVIDNLSILCAEIKKQNLSEEELIELTRKNAMDTNMFIMGSKELIVDNLVH